MHDATSRRVSAVSYPDNVQVFFQDKTEYLSGLGLNPPVGVWDFTPMIEAPQAKLLMHAAITRIIGPHTKTPKIPALG